MLDCSVRHSASSTVERQVRMQVHIAEVHWMQFAAAPDATTGRPPPGRRSRSHDKWFAIQSTVTAVSTIIARREETVENVGVPLTSPAA
jgi:hypothetical protein